MHEIIFKAEVEGWEDEAWNRGIRDTGQNENLGV